MGFIDSISAEDRVEVKFSQFYDLMLGCAERKLLVNAVKTKVPHEYIENMLTGKLVASQEEEVKE